MKRSIAMILLVCIFAAGCTVSPSETAPVSTQASSQEPSTDTFSESTTPTAETTLPTQPAISPTLMEQAKPVGTLNNTWYIPNDAVAELEYPSMQLFGDALLLSAGAMDAQGSRRILKLISLETGEEIAATSFPGSGFVTIQTGADGIGVCDVGAGSVRILDGMLREHSIYQLDTNNSSWYLSPNLEKLYQIDAESGIRAIALSAGTTEPILTDAAQVYVRGLSAERIIVTYLDLSSQQMTGKSLNLKTGALEALPVDTAVSSAACVDDTWLLGDGSRWDTYYLLANGQCRVAVWPENRFALLSPKKHLLAVDGAGRAMKLYDTDGRFLSVCQLPAGGSSSVGIDTVWSDTWNGYFFLDFQESMNGKLMFWDPQIPVSGEDLPLTVKEDAPEVAQALYDRAEALSARFGLDIRIAEQCQLRYLNFTSYALSDAAAITRALDILEATLSAYPEGFLEQLKHGSIQRIQIELVGGLQPVNTAVYEGSYTGFALSNAGYYLIVLDANTMHGTSVFHEIAHVIDAKIVWDAGQRTDALFSEERWLALQPKGFVYANSYAQLPQEILAFAASGYFVRDYSCRFPTEDRATMMEAATGNHTVVFQSNPHLLPKLEYYCRCIRDCFDSSDWPEVTVWEELLQN